jgi:hypothetical protein
MRAADVVRKTMRGAVVLLVAGLAASAVRALEPMGSHMTPPSQPPLGVIAGRDLTPVQAIFNRDLDRPRIFVLLSPT